MERIRALRDAIPWKTRGPGMIAAAGYHGKTFIGSISPSISLD
jgi:hypothetical protein